MIAKSHYNSRFTNRYGEEWEFEYDPLKKEGVLRGSDVEWQDYRVIEGRVPGRVLSAELKKSESVSRFGGFWGG